MKRDLVNEMLNKCCSANKVDTKYTRYGYEDIHQIGNTKVVLTFNQYSNGEDDYDDELVSVEVIENSLLDNLKADLADLKNPLGMLGR